MLSLYLPGDTLLHRQPAGRKLALLIAAGIGLFLVASPAVLAMAALAAASLLLSVRPPLEQIRRQLLGPFLVLAAIFIAAALLDGLRPAFAVLFRLAALILLASAVTLSTRTSEMLEACETALRPLERIGLLNAARVSLAVSLVLRFVPEIFRHYHEIREAQAARGLHGNPVALVVPLLVRTLRAADDVAAAIDARCYPPPAPASNRPQHIGKTPLA
ncbi:MAG TPA: energy-coupling factor transporter transmembrane protein EcfT [Stellaceae bacterium]